MMKLWNRVRVSATRWLAALVMAGAVAGFGGDAFATDKVKLKSGETIEGTIVREEDGAVWIEIDSGGLKQQKFVTSGEIESIERDSPKQDAAGEGTDLLKDVRVATEDDKGQVSKKRPGVTRAVVLTLGDNNSGHDMVGTYMTAKTLMDAIPALERDEIDVVVLRISSGGGALLEIQRLSDAIQNEYKKRFRVVAWIEWAISAAAMTAHCVNEIYMTPQGAYGGCTGWSGDLVAVKGFDLERVLFQMEKITARGGHKPELMRAMQIMAPLSVTVGQNGDVEYFQDTTSGKILLNPEGRVLTLNSQTAAQIRFSSGTARTLKDLEKAMGLAEVEWVGRKIPGIEWPVSRAEQIQMDFRDRTAQDEERIQEYFFKYQAAFQAAQGAEPDLRAKLVGRAQEALRQIEAMVKNNPNLSLFLLNMLPEDFKQWMEEREKELRELLRKR